MSRTRTEGHVGHREDVQRVKRGRRLDVDRRRRVERSEGERTLHENSRVRGVWTMETTYMRDDVRVEDAVFARARTDGAVVLGEV